MMTHCCAIVKILLIVQYTTSPEGNGANMIVKNIGKNIKIFACIGSGGVGFNFCCKYMVSPMRIGHTPIIKKVGGSYGINPNKLNIEVGSLADKSCIQPKKGCCLISIVTYSIL